MSNRFTRIHNGVHEVEVALTSVRVWVDRGWKLVTEGNDVPVAAPVAAEAEKPAGVEVTKASAPSPAQTPAAPAPQPAKAVTPEQPATGQEASNG